LCVCPLPRSQPLQRALSRFAEPSKFSSSQCLEGHDQRLGRGVGEGHPSGRDCMEPTFARDAIASRLCLRLFQLIALRHPHALRGRGSQEATSALAFSRSPRGGAAVRRDRRLTNESVPAAKSAFRGLNATARTALPFEASRLRIGSISYQSGPSLRTGGWAPCKGVSTTSQTKTWPLAPPASGGGMRRAADCQPSSRACIIGPKRLQ
jgi:hypothetical protein